MPKIPQYESSENISRSAGLPYISTPPESGVGQFITETGRRLFNIGEKFRQAQVTSEVIEASLNIKEQLNRLKQEALKDPDWGNLPDKYYNQAVKIKDQALKRIKYPEARKAINLKVSNWLLPFQTDINRIYRKRVVDYGKAMSMRLDTQFVNDYARSDNKLERQQLAEDYRLAKEALVKQGIISYQEWEKTKKELPKQLVETMAQINPMGVMAEIKKGADGEFGYILKQNPALFAELRRIAQKGLDEYRRQYRQGLWEKFLAGDLSPMDIAVAADRGDLSEKQAKDAIKWFKNEFGEPMKIHQVKSDVTFIDSVEQIAKGEEIDVEALYSDKELSFTDAGKLYNLQKIINSLDDNQRNAVLGAIKKVSATPTSADYKSEVYRNILQLAEASDFDSNKIIESVNDYSRDYLQAKYPYLSKLEVLPDYVMSTEGISNVIKLGKTSAGGKVIVAIPDYNTVVTFNANTPAEEIQRTLYDQYYPALTNFQIQEEAKQEGKESFVKGITKEFLWGIASGIVDTQKFLIEAGKYALKLHGLLEPARKVKEALQKAPVIGEVVETNFSEKHLQEISNIIQNRMNDLRKGKTGISKYTYIVAGEVGGLLPTIITWEVGGSVVKNGVLLKVIPRNNILYRIIEGLPNFVVGGASGEAVSTWIHNEKTLLPKLNDTFLKTSGQLLSLYTFAQLGRIGIKATPETISKTLAKNFFNITSRAVVGGTISVAHSLYNSIIEGRIPSYEEIKESYISGASMILALEMLSGIIKTSKDINEINRTKKIAKEIDKAIKEGNFDINRFREELPNEVKSVIDNWQEIARKRGEKRKIEETPILEKEKPLKNPLEEAMYQYLSEPGRVLTQQEKVILEMLRNKREGRKNELLEEPAQKVAEEPQQNPIEESVATKEQPVEISVRETKTEYGNPLVKVTGIPNFPDIPSAVKSFFKNLSEKIPTFLGGKRKMFTTTAYLIDTLFTPEQKAKIHTIYDLFGGSGGFGKTIAEAVNFPNLKKIVINELSKNKVMAIKYLHERGHMIAEDLKAIRHILRQIDNEVKATGTTSGSSYANRIAKYIAANKGNLTEKEIGLLQHLVNRGLASFANKKEGESIKTIENLIALAEKDAKEFKSNSDILKARGVDIEIRQGDAYELGRAIRDSGVLAIVDPPYYMTAGYKEGGTKSNELNDINIYRQTNDLVKHLYDNKVPTIYTEEAWWMKNEGKKSNNYLPDYKEGKQILANTLKLGYNWYSDKLPQTKRYELLGVYNGEENRAITRGETGSGAPAVGAVDRRVSSGREGLREGGERPGLSAKNNARESRTGKPERRIITHEENLPQKSQQPSSQPSIKLYGGIPLDEIAEGLKNLDNKLKKLYAPEGVSKEAWEAAKIIRKSLGTKAREVEVFLRSSEVRRKFWSKLSKNENIAFMKAIEKGEKTGNPEVDKFISAYREILDKAYEMSKTLDEKIHYVKDYFPHIFKDTKKARDFLKQYFKRIGREGFSKERYFNLIEEALNAGLELKYDNVEDVIRARYMSALTSKMKADFINEMIDKGLLFKDKRYDLSAIDTPKGRFYADENVARLINRVMQTSLFTQKGLLGDIFRGYMQAKNIFTATKLAISGFHAIGSTISDMTNQLVLAAKKLGRGDFKGFVKELAKTPVSPVLSFIKGGKLSEAYLKGANTPEEKEFVKIFTTVDGRIRMPREYRIRTEQAIDEALKNGKWGKALGSTVANVIRAIQKPLMEVYVPRLKVAKFWETYSDWVKAHPKATESQKIDYATRLWDSMDNRLGELVYDNLFWDQRVKDAAIASTLSLGWNLGSAREAGGAIKDLIELALVNSDNPAFVDRILFVTLYPLVAGFIGGTIHYILTGERPKEIRDLYYPRTGRKNPDGSDERLTLPAYTKDYFAIKNAIQKEGVIKGLITVAGHKSAPVLSMGFDILRNKNYYGVKIRDVKSPASQQAIDTLKFIFEWLEPISVSSARRMSVEDSLLMKTLPFVGLSKAPAYVTRSKIQNKIYNLLADHYHADITRSEYEKKVKLKEYIEKAERDKENAHKILKEAYKKGLFGDDKKKALNKFKRIVKNLKYPPDVVAFGYLTSEEQEDVWKQMNDKEKAKYYIKLHKNIRNKLLTSEVLRKIRETKRREK